MKSPKLASAYGWLTLEIWLLIALGGGVRAMNAGLACPDWPLCFGDVIPDYHPQVYMEFIHRAMAGMVAIVSVILTVLVWRNKRLPKSLKWLSLGALVLLAAQIIFGGLTVLLLLHANVVAVHLLLGASFFALNLWMYMSLKGEGVEVAPMSVGLYRFIRVVAGLVVLQILLGGLVASNYAATVCAEFPLCAGQWIPTLHGPIGLQVMHRLNAYLTTAAILVLYFWSGRSRTAGWLVVGVLFQMGLGIANVLLYAPPLITVLHLATAIGILALVCRLLKVPGRKSSQQEVNRALNPRTV